MPAPINGLKAALAGGRIQLGLWLGLASPITAEIAAGAGFDWCVIDGEHAPYDVTAIREQLIAMAGRGAHPVVRVPVGEAWIIKQVLDLGVQSVLVPMIDSAAEARAAVAATRYPPEGVRGVGAVVARASDYSGVDAYTATANAQICTMVQVESRAALDDLDAITAVEGVDCVFIGPADLAADMGFRDTPGAPEVVAAIEDAIARIRSGGKAAGIITFDPSQFAHFADLGVTFLGLGGDTTLLANAMRELAASAKAATSP